MLCQVVEELVDLDAATHTTPRLLRLHVERNQADPILRAQRCRGVQNRITGRTQVTGRTELPAHAPGNVDQENDTCR